MHAHTHALGLAKKLKPQTTENNSAKHITTAKRSAERLWSHLVIGRPCRSNTASMASTQPVNICPPPRQGYCFTLRGLTFGCHVSKICWIYFSYLYVKQHIENVCNGEANSKTTWNVTGWTSEFLLFLSLLAAAPGFLFVQRASPDVHHHPMVSHNVQRYYW